MPAKVKKASPPRETKKPATTKPAEEPPAKKPREKSPPKKEEPKKEEPKVETTEEEPKFVEPDAPKDSRSVLKEKVGFETVDMTLNVIPTAGGKLLMPLTDGGMSFLLAGARGSVAQKGGRYMFEAKIIQLLDGAGDKRSKHTLKIGFSTAESSLILGEDDMSVSFDNTGTFTSKKQKIQVRGGAFIRDQVIAVVLNLDSKSPNANTVALYRDGVLCGEPMKLPEQLQGTPLFPHVTFRNASVVTNFGPSAFKELPFKCRMLQGAAASDCFVPPSKTPKDGKYEVMMPVAFPDEGTFEWLDDFMKKNPQYVELSDRKIIQWAHASGFYSKSNVKGSLDKPAFGFNIPAMDDLSTRKVINAIAPAVPRNYVIMEVRANLVASERKEVLKKFNYPCYKKVAKVVMGEPSKEFKTVVQNKLLKDKQAKADIAWKAKRAEVLRRKQNEKKQKEIAKKKKEFEKQRKVAVEKALAAAKKKTDEKKEEDTEEIKDDPMEDKEKEEDKSESEVEEEEETEPPVVELTDEEKKTNFLQKTVPDLTPQILSSSFAKFTTPEKDEGFDDIQYEWDKGPKAKDYLKKWVLNKKATTRIEDIKPGKDFKEKLAEFVKLSKTWQEKLTAHKASGKKSTKKADEEENEIDIYSVEDVCNAGNGAPLFENWTSEDWELMRLRAEFGLLLFGFKQDCDDPDRAGIPVDHVTFYFSRYFSRNVNPKMFGCADQKEVLGLIKDTVTLKDCFLVSQISDDLDNLDIFLKLTEESRRERQRRIDAGDETARLKFVIPDPRMVASRPEVKKPEEKASETGAEKAEAKAAPRVVPPKSAMNASKGKGKF